MNPWLVNTDYRRPCVVLTSLEHDKPCGTPCGDHTILGWPLCDDCYTALYDPTVDTTARTLPTLGGVDVA